MLIYHVLQTSSLIQTYIDWACKELCYGQHGNRIYHHSPDLHCIFEPNKRNVCRLPLSTLLWISIHIFKFSVAVFQLALGIVADKFGSLLTLWICVGVRYVHCHVHIVHEAI